MTSLNPDLGDRGAMSSAISNAVVQLTRDYTGRGATESRTYIDGDLITCVLRDYLTKAEQTLVASGRLEHVLITRREFQRAMRDDLVSAVETLTQRHVIAFMSDNHVDPDIAAEIFVLEPLPDSDAPTAAG